MKAIFAQLLLLISISVFAAEDMVVSFRSPESAADRRYEYELSLLRLALDKTISTHGSYRIEFLPPMNNTRAEVTMKLNSYPNFIANFSYEKRLEALELDYVRFPILLGIIGYRVCFVSPQKKESVARVRSFEELKAFTHGQGSGWADVEILRANGLTVIEVPKYQNLFERVAGGRIDLFCRGANELENEWKAHADLKDLTYDRSILIKYPLAQFFYTHKSNSALIERVTDGVRQVYADGSLRTLWEKHYRSSVDFAELPARRVFKLKNPLLESIDFDFERYDFDRPVKKDGK